MNKTDVQDPIIIFSNLLYDIDTGTYGSMTCFNGYGSKEEIEDAYDILLTQDELNLVNSWEDVHKSAIEYCEKHNISNQKKKVTI